ncbi:MAG TPA: GrlR family regulatory protein [Desulfomicrobiaceae bacterium]|nr:GrlR family regulatory protein [Desulfomicrobiaceae bacterium]
MQKGIYEFTITSPATLSAVMVLSETGLHGGCDDYLFKGRVVREGEKVSGTLEVIKRTSEGPALLGRFKTVVLLLTGTIDENGVLSWQAIGGGHHVINLQGEGGFLVGLD